MRLSHLTRRVAPARACGTFTLGFLVCLAAFSLTAAAQDSSALINEALDKRVDLELNDVLPGAMRAIETKTGVPIKADPAVWELLPWGEQTNVTAKIQNLTLRQALAAITQKLGLTFSLGDEAVSLQPMPALRRLGRRSTVQELQALDLLASKPMPEVNGVPKVQGILTAIDVQLDAMKSAYAIENRVPPDIRAQQIDIPRNATMLDALEQVAKQTKATWYPWGRMLVVVPKEVQIRDQLAKTFTARYNGAEVGQVLDDLRHRSGVDFQIEPGAVQKIPADFRSVKVFWENVSIAQALESLKGFTGLDYQVSEKGVSITNPSPAAALAGGGSGDPVVGFLQLENGMQLMLRESQVPADVRAYLKHRTQKELDQLREMARREGFPLTQPSAPPTAPTTSPAQPPAKAKDL